MPATQVNSVVSQLPPIYIVPKAGQRMLRLYVYLYVYTNQKGFKCSSRACDPSMRVHFADPGLTDSSQTAANSSPRHARAMTPRSRTINKQLKQKPKNIEG